MATSAADMLELVETAYKKALVAQSYTTRGEEVRRGDVDRLYKQWKDLRALVDAESTNSGSMCTLGETVPAR